MAATARTRVASPVPAWRGVRADRHGRVDLALRRLGPADAAVAAMVGLCRAPACRSRRLCAQRPPGCDPGRLVVAPLALRRTRQAAGAAAEPDAVRPPPRHGHAVAGYRRCL